MCDSISKVLFRLFFLCVGQRVLLLWRWWNCLEFCSFSSFVIFMHTARKMMNDWNFDRAHALNTTSLLLLLLLSFRCLSHTFRTQYWMVWTHNRLLLLSVFFFFRFHTHTHIYSTSTNLALTQDNEQHWNILLLATLFCHNHRCYSANKFNLFFHDSCDCVCMSLCVRWIMMYGSSMRTENDERRKKRKMCDLSVELLTANWSFTEIVRNVTDRASERASE